VVEEAANGVADAKNGTIKQSRRRVVREAAGTLAIVPFPLMFDTSRRMGRLILTGDPVFYQKNLVEAPTGRALHTVATSRGRCSGEWAR
jgi:hypothetical protein